MASSLENGDLGGGWTRDLGTGRQLDGATSLLDAVQSLQLKDKDGVHTAA